LLSNLLINRKQLKDQITRLKNTNNILQSFGYETTVLNYNEVISPFYQNLYFSAIVSFAIFLYITFPGILVCILSTIIILIALVSLVFELLHKPNLYNLLPNNSKNYNLVTKSSPINKSEKIIVLFANIDQFSKPWFSKTIWKKLLLLLLPVEFAVTMLTILSIIISEFFHSPIIIVVIGTVILLILKIIISLITIANYSPNVLGQPEASGFEAQLKLAKFIAQNPLERTNLFFVFSGKKDFALHGSRKFLQKYRKQLKNSFWISAENGNDDNTIPEFLIAEQYFYIINGDSKLTEISKQIQNEMRISIKSNKLKLNFLSNSFAAKSQGLKTLTILPVQSEMHTNPDNYFNYLLDLVQKVDSAS